MPRAGGYHWNVAASNTDALANSDDSMDLTLTLWKFSRTGQHSKVSSDHLTYGQMSQNKNVSLAHAKITEVVIKKKESFLDYVFGGCEVGL